LLKRFTFTVIILNGIVICNQGKSENHMIFGGVSTLLMINGYRIGKLPENEIVG